MGRTPCPTGGRRNKPHRARRYAASAAPNAANKVRLTGLGIGHVLGMPLHGKRKARRLADADGLDGVVLPPRPRRRCAGPAKNALAVQRIDPDGLGAEELCEYAAGREPDLVAVGDR